MPKLLFIADHRPNRSPSQRFRFEQFIPYFEKAGYTIDYSYLLNEEDDRIFYQPKHYVKKAKILAKAWRIRREDLKRAKEYAIVFIQREAILGASTYFERKFAQSGAKVIYDFDDSIWRLDISAANRRFGFLKNPKKTSKIIAHATVVIAGNAYLADYAKQFNKNVLVIPTCIDTSKHVPLVKKEKSETITIGWTGSLTTLKHFELSLNFLRKLKEKYPGKIQIKHIGNPGYVYEELGIYGEAWRPDKEVEELQKIDIGIMPLPNDEWSKGKCGLKGLQYMALGIPTVMSNVGVNNEIIESGKNGFLADDENEWIAALSLLIEDEDLRKSIGEAGRKTVLKNYSVDANLEKYFSLFNKLLNT